MVEDWYCDVGYFVEYVVIVVCVVELLYVFDFGV